tara:strand:- start:1983 stop:2147 length:165 start_codon:yes stop_codon:yes gene_type:complete
MPSLTFPEKKQYLDLLAIPEEKMTPDQTRLLLDLEEKRKEGLRPKPVRRGEPDA